MYVAYDASIGKIYEAFTSETETKAKELLKQTVLSRTPEQIRGDIEQHINDDGYLESIGLTLYDIGNMNWMTNIGNVGYGGYAVRRIAEEAPQHINTTNPTFIDYLRLKCFLGYLRMEFEYQQATTEYQSEDYRLNSEFVSTEQGTTYVRAALVRTQYNDNGKYTPIIEIKLPLSEFPTCEQAPLHVETITYDLNTVKQELGV